MIFKFNRNVKKRKLVFVKKFNFIHITILRDRDKTPSKIFTFPKPS